MSIANDKVVTMTNDELYKKAEEVSEYFMLVFEDYWMRGGKDFDGDIVEFCLFTHNLSFQTAFAYAHGLIERDGLTEKGVGYINEVYDILMNGMDLG